MRKRMSSMIIVLIFTISTFSLIGQSAKIDVGEIKSIVTDDLRYSTHAPIRINSNMDFDEEHGVVNWATGNGSAGNPWVIEDYDINGTGYGYCLFIGNTTEHFVVRDCYMHEASGAGVSQWFGDSGIMLANSDNGQVNNNTVISCDKYGYYLYYSDNNRLMNNTGISNGIYSIYLLGSSVNIVDDNTFSQNVKGMLLWNSDNNTVSNNIVKNNPSGGIQLTSSNCNVIHNNTIFNNLNGFNLVGTTSYNKIYHNGIIDNSNQASGTGINYWNDTYPSGGNFWSDYSGSDNFNGPEQDIPGSDGIGDTNYTIPGGTNVDEYPLMEANGGPVHNVNKDTYYLEIQPAIDDADPGNTITVSNGVYDERLQIQKTLTLIGENRDSTIIDAGFSGDVVNISADWVNFTGFTVRNSGTGWPDEGMELYGCQYCNINNNRFFNNYYYGVYLVFSDNNVIKNNHFSNNTYHDSFVGIVLSYSNNNLVIENQIVDFIGTGIVMGSSESNTFYSNEMEGCGFHMAGFNVNNFATHTIPVNNTVNGKPVYYYKNTNMGYASVPSDAGQTIAANVVKLKIENLTSNNVTFGAIIAHSSDVIISNNTFNYRGSGIQLYTSSNCILEDNECSFGHTGIYLYEESNNNEIRYNTCNNNEWAGIRLYNSNLNVIRNNDIKYNYGYTGVHLNPDCNSNILYHNNFISNNIQAVDQANNQWNNGYPSGGNYWNDYVGVDGFHSPGQDQPGSDGIGDTPYMIDVDSQDDYPLMSTFDYMEYEIPLQLGWNLLSIPVRQLDYSIGSVLESIGGKWDCIQTYDPGTDTWLSNNVHRPAVLNDINEMNHMHGYWINITEPGLTLIVKGDAFNSSISIPLHAGWTVLGYPSITEQSISDALTGTCYNQPVEGFDGGAPYHICQLLDAYLMKPGEGYWVHVPTDSIWIIDW